MEDVLIKILIIDDDFAVRSSLDFLLKQKDFCTLCAINPTEAEDILKEEKVDLILLDMNFSRETSGVEGIEFLTRLKSVLPLVPVILITAWGSIELAVEGMKNGAADFVTKPWKNDNLINSIKTVLKIKSDIITNDHLSREELDDLYDFDMFISKDPEVLRILQTLGQVSKTDASVLIMGESGTGKELLAEAIHRNSLRKNEPFVKVNLGGIPTALFESEMFGHKKGAFTDAQFDRKGRFETADKGTIFLDEIGEVNPGNQVKLLRVLQDKTFESLGSSLAKQVDIRVISATNRKLSKEVENGNFREDLFYRINLISLTIPPLRKRVNDIPLMVDHFLSRYREIYQKPGLVIDSNAVNWLKYQRWPGNVRQLKNLLERAILTNRSNLINTENLIKQQQDVPVKESKRKLPEVGLMTLEEIEIAMIKKASVHYKKNMSMIAKSLGMSRAALYRRIEKYSIEL